MGTTGLALAMLVDGKDAGPVEDGWNWCNAWRRPNGDAWDSNPTRPGTPSWCRSP